MFFYLIKEIDKTGNTTSYSTPQPAMETGCPQSKYGARCIKDLPAK